jgi:enoyl-CoA hydratase
MSNYKNLLEDFQDGILTITINRPEKLNALNTLTLSEIKSCVQDAYDTPEVKGIIMIGSGKKAFVSGADISEFTELNEMNGRKFAERGQEIFALLENCHKPVVAVVNGYASGGRLRIGSGMSYTHRNRECLFWPA